MGLASVPTLQRDLTFTAAIDGIGRPVSEGRVTAQAMASARSRKSALRRDEPSIRCWIALTTVTFWCRNLGLSVRHARG